MYYAGTEHYSVLQFNIEVVNHDIKVFQSALRDYVLKNSFCAIEKCGSSEGS
jgi:hypothetical protein